MMIANLRLTFLMSPLFFFLLSGALAQAQAQDRDIDECSFFGNTFSDFGSRSHRYSCPSSDKTYLTTPLLTEFEGENVGRSSYWRKMYRFESDFSERDEGDRAERIASVFDFGDDRGEDDYLDHLGIKKVVYLEAAGLKEFSPTIRDGLFFDANNRPWNTGKFGQIFVMDSTGRFFIKPENDLRELYHSSLSGGQPVAAAGEMIIENGVLISLNDKSGHYLPRRIFIEQALERLKELGVSYHQQFKFCPLSSPKNQHPLRH